MEGEKDVDLLSTVIYTGNKNSVQHSNTALQIVPEELVNLVCRTCLTTSTSVQSIFKANFDQMIMECTSVKIFQGDGFPSQICLNCIAQLTQAYSFKQQVENCGNTLSRFYVHKEMIDVKDSMDDCLEEPMIEFADNRFNIEIIKEEVKEEMESVDCSINSEENENPFETEDNLISQSDKLPKVHYRMVTEFLTQRSELSIEEIHRIRVQWCLRKMEQRKNEPPPLIYIVKSSQTNTQSQLCSRESINLVCRTCLASHSDFQSIFEMNFEKVIMGFTSVKILKEDGLPSQICSNCVTKLNQTYMFKQQIEQVDHALQQLLLYKEVMQCEDEPKTECDVSINDNNDRLTDKHPENSFNIDIVKNEIKEEIETDHCEIKTEEKEKTNGTEKNSMPSKELVEQKCDNFTTCHTNSNLKTYLCSCESSEKKHKCIWCSEQSSTESELKVHKEKHNGKNFQCHICKKYYSTRWTLAKHIKIHTGNKMFECEFCDKKFIDSYGLTIHHSIHMGKKPYVCFVCGHSSAVKEYLALHMRIHNNEKLFTCSICSKVFRTTSGLSKHKLNHVGLRKYPCSICRKGFQTSSELRVHIISHNIEKPYKCKLPSCTKQYTSRNQLIEHLRVHSGKKSHQCLTCIKIFPTSTGLQRHKYVHTGNKPYLCNICGFMFTQLGTLNKHIRRVHKTLT